VVKAPRELIDDVVVKTKELKSLLLNPVTIEFKFAIDESEIVEADPRYLIDKLYKVDNCAEDQLFAAKPNNVSHAMKSLEDKVANESDDKLEMPGDPKLFNVVHVCCSVLLFLRDVLAPPDSMYK